MTRGDNNVSKSGMKQRTDWVVWARTSSPKREASGHRDFETYGRVLVGQGVKGKATRGQVMRGRETRTGATHVDGRDGGNEEMSKPSRVHGQCRAGFTRWQKVKDANRYLKMPCAVRLKRMNAG